MRKSESYGNGKSSALALVAAAVLGLAGCAPSTQLSEDDLTRSHAFRPPIEVERTVHEHLVLLDPTKPEISEQQRRSLYGFLVGVGAQPGDTVIIAARRARLDHRSEIVQFARQLGLNPDLRLIKEPKPGAEDDGYDTAILVRFDRYVTRKLECGRWKHDYATRFNNVNPPDFGCTNTAALQQQVAYPSSLIAGEPLDFSEGDVAAASVSRYRGRKTEKIKIEAAASK